MNETLKEQITNEELNNKTLNNELPEEKTWKFIENGQIAEKQDNNSILKNIKTNIAIADDDINKIKNIDNDIENTDLVETEENECKALTTVKERRLLVAQTLFKKTIRISLKSFLISLSLSFLNLFT